MTLQKKDFLEIEFTGKIKETGEVFDSNIKQELDKINSKQPVKPFVFALGEDMFLKGIDDFLIGKEIGKHTIELEAKKAFGPRDPSMIKLMPMILFRKHNLNPVQGVTLNFDGKMGKILSVSGGRVRVDFNNSLAGRDVVYEVDIKRKIEDLNEKAKSLIEFFTRQDLPFEIKEKKLIIKTEEQIKKFLELFKDKFKEILDLDLDLQESEKKDTKESQ